MTALPAPATHRRGWRRRLLQAGLVLLILSLAWLVWAYRAVEHPHTDRPTHADAVLLLGPLQTPRLDQAIRLTQELAITQLVVSIGDTPGQKPGSACATAPPGVTLTCFRPDPYTTRGEARELRRLSQAHGWRTVIVIAPRPQISRAHYLMRRCYDHRLEMVPADLPGAQGVSSFQLRYQMAALAKAHFLQWGC